MRYNDRTIESVSQVLAALRQQVKPKQQVWFRGHSRWNWKLVPGLARTQVNLRAEHALIKRFMQNAMPLLPTPPRDEWAWMFLMQHHRASTRLLDWSESPLAALYFAVQDPEHMAAIGTVWCLDALALNREANLKFEFELEIPAAGSDGVLDSYLPSRVQESPSELSPLAIIGPRNTARMAAQLGCFTINHRRHTPIEAIENGQHVWRWKIPARAKTKILRELALLGYTGLTLFPELDRVADLSKELLR